MDALSTPKGNIKLNEILLYLATRFDGKENIVRDYTRIILLVHKLLSCYRDCMFNRLLMLIDSVRYSVTDSVTGWLANTPTLNHEVKYVVVTRLHVDSIYSVFSLHKFFSII